MALLRRRHPEEKPVDLKRRLARAMASRQSRQNLDALGRAGIRVRYIAADVTDAAAVGQALQDGPAVNVLIHAAGLEESQPLAKKGLEQFARVFDTKVAGLGHLLAALQGHPLRSVIGFSSVTARLGNAGQADYTAANDMLGRMLQRHQQAHPETVCKTLAWTAWDGAGMATRETVRRVLTQRGLTFLPLEQGVRFFIDELADATAPRSGFYRPGPAHGSRRDAGGAGALHRCPDGARGRRERLPAHPDHGAGPVPGRPHPRRGAAVSRGHRDRGHGRGGGLERRPAAGCRWN